LLADFHISFNLFREYNNFEVWEAKMYNILYFVMSYDDGAQNFRLAHPIVIHTVTNQLGCKRDYYDFLS